MFRRLFHQPRPYLSMWLTSLVTPITFPRIVNSSGSSSPALYHSLSPTIVLALWHSASCSILNAPFNVNLTCRIPNDPPEISLSDISPLLAMCNWTYLDLVVLLLKVGMLDRHDTIPLISYCNRTRPYVSISQLHRN